MTDGPPIWTGSRYMGPRPIDIEAMWHPYGLSKLQRILNGNILRPMIAPDNEVPIWEESRKICTLKMIFFRRKVLSVQEIGVGSILL